MSESRAAIMYCPYCAEEDLVPAEIGWACRSCLRVFSVTLHGLTAPPGTASPIRSGDDQRGPR